MKNAQPIRSSWPWSSLVLGMIALPVLACAGVDDADPTRETPDTGALRDEVNEVIDAIDTLDRSHGAFLRDVEVMAPQLLSDERVVRVGTALDGLRTAAAVVELHADAVPDHLEAVRALGVPAGQLVPQLRRLGKQLRASELDEGTRKAFLQHLTRVRLAAESVDGAVADLVGDVDGDAVKAKLSLDRFDGDAAAEAIAQSGPLFPGSAIYVIDEGHVDALDAAFEDDALGLSIHDESVTPDVEREIKKTILVAKASAKVQVPDDRFPFLGAPGANVWILPEAQPDAEAAGILWPGVATEEIEPGVFLDDTVRFRIKSVVGPDGFSMFLSPQDEQSPPTVLVDSENGLPDVLPQGVGIHQHMNWAFEAPGIYLVKVDVRGRLADVPGNPWVTSATETLKWVVLP